ncbi:hypothetical protein PR202_gb29664 [Eleusine coracana subsp. coracana]|uniref:Uncharacterized protein n=1 Tax=Eleusine coracana subsp. coracana TaxID=191504 RepID=A0AAV5FXR6_ELECO|nr:hypothetical protein PR202_gb29664 [Eleusine coracana subsp. coracana]
MLEPRLEPTGARGGGGARAWPLRLLARSKLAAELEEEAGARWRREEGPNGSAREREETADGGAGGGGIGPATAAWVRRRDPTAACGRGRRRRPVAMARGRRGTSDTR